jgi:hypothetical protein
MKREIFRVQASAIVPSDRAILESQGIPVHTTVSDSILQLTRDAVGLYLELAAPVGMVMEISSDEFSGVFGGEGKNQAESPVLPIALAADALAIYAVTVGDGVSHEITRRFALNDFALGCMLDAVASEGTELLARHAELLYEQATETLKRSRPNTRLMRFSPGYCGWHVSGQRKLFGFLHPEEIGITLRESCLMQPLKSISGVIIAGDERVFYFEDAFAFCGECTTHVCRDRLAALRGAQSLR